VTTERSCGFPPVSRPDARVLVLGSLPGVRSLEASRYYAQPQNVFWRIMGEIYGAAPSLSYPDRLERLVAARVALWDVVAAAVRPGSLDSRIRRDSVEVNDFAAFLDAHKRIERICFNGATAADLFRRRVLPGLGQRAPAGMHVLPSTSPAHAGMPFTQKLHLWQCALRFDDR